MSQFQFPQFLDPDSEDKQYDGRLTPRGGSIELKNPHIDDQKEDVLYHLDLGNKSHDLPAMFGNIKFVCFGGSPNRMKKFAYFMVNELQEKIPAGMALSNISGGSDRYVLYKVGPVLSVSHGMGIPSLSIVFHEILKLLYHSGCSDVKMFRLGTSGGLGAGVNWDFQWSTQLAQTAESGEISISCVDPGTVVISEEAVDGILRPYMEIATLGMILQHPAFLDKVLCEELRLIGQEDTDYQTVVGKTMCTYDFYEGQGRLDGAFCDFTEGDKMAFLEKIHQRGILNIEMESLCFAAMAHRARVKSAVLCCTILDRLNGDQITASHETLEEWQMRPQRIIAKYIKRQLALHLSHD